MDDETFLAQFEARTLPFDQWSHRAHVRVAYLYLRAHDLEDAMARIRAGIKAYNAANNVPEGPGVGYNETLTQAWVRIIHATMEAWETVLPTATSDAFCEAHPHLLHRSLLRAFYSPRCRPKVEAQRHAFVPPDMCPLPRYEPEP